jgi:hypothetical protein
MSGKYTEKDHEEYRRKVDEQAAKEERERRERIEKEGARQEWVREGGDPDDFENEWIWMRDEGRRRRVVDADRHARETMRASRVSSI